VALLSWLSFSLSSFTSGFENTFCPAPAPVFNNDPNVNVVDPWPNTLAGDDDARAEKGEAEVTGTAAHGLFCVANAAPNCQHNQKEKKSLCQGPIPICNCTTVMILLQRVLTIFFSSGLVSAGAESVLVSTAASCSLSCLNFLHKKQMIQSFQLQKSDGSHMGKRPLGLRKKRKKKKEKDFLLCWTVSWRLMLT